MRYSGFQLAGTDPIDLAGVVDVTGDAVPDFARLIPIPQPSVECYSGLDGSLVMTQDFLNDEYWGVAMATVADSNADGVANDPALAVLGHRARDKNHKVQVRRLDDNSVVNAIEFLGPNWDVIDVAVIDDLNGDGVPGDAAIAVLAFNAAASRAYQKTIVQVRRLSNKKLVAQRNYLNGAWRPVAIEAINRIDPEGPLLAVLSRHPETNDIACKCVLFIPVPYTLISSYCATGTGLFRTSRSYRTPMAMMCSMTRPLWCWPEIS